LFTSSAYSVEVLEENLLDVALFREVFVDNILDNKLKANSSAKIIFLAKKRIGERGYDLITNNCQHFCTSVRYGVEISPEVEETSFNGVFFN